MPKTSKYILMKVFSLVRLSHRFQIVLCHQSFCGFSLNKKLSSKLLAICILIKVLQLCRSINYVITVFCEKWYNLPKEKKNYLTKANVYLIFQFNESVKWIKSQLVIFIVNFWIKSQVLTPNKNHFSFIRFFFSPEKI